MPPRKGQPRAAQPEGEEPARREGRVFVTLPRVHRERLRATLAARGWLTPEGQPQRGAETEVVTEWLMDYARLRGWLDSAPPSVAPALPTPEPPPPAGDEEDDFGFKE